MKKQHIIIEKVPLSVEEKIIDRKPNFPKNKTLYLELIENKNKIKPYLVNKDYNPAENSSDNEKQPLNFVDNDNNDDKNDNSVKDEVKQDQEVDAAVEVDNKADKIDTSDNKDKDNEDHSDSDFEKKFENMLSDRKRKKKRDSSNNDDYVNGNETLLDSLKNRYEKQQNTTDTLSQPENKEVENINDLKILEIGSIKNVEDLNMYIHKDDTGLEDKEYKDDKDSKDDKDNKDGKEEYDNKSDISDGLSVRLRQLLEDDRESVHSQKRDDGERYKRKNEDKYDKHDKHDRRDKREERYGRDRGDRDRDGRDKYSRSHSGDNNIRSRDIERSCSSRHEYPVKNHDPPTLSQIESRGGNIRKREMVNLDYVSMEEHDEEDLKRELMFKFDLLKKSYSGATIPEFSIHTDYNTMKKTYDGLVRKLTLDSTVDGYKTYLIAGFMGSEFLLGNYLGFDMEGFTSQQILQMHKYEKLLIELGEKSYVPEGEGWSVELRLLFLVIMQSAFFIISKMIMKKTGANLMNMLNGMNSNTAARPPLKKRKMKGPDVNIDELP